jgi:hypothetical protein
LHIAKHIYRKVIFAGNHTNYAVLPRLLSFAQPYKNNKYSAVFVRDLVLKKDWELARKKGISSIFHVLKEHLDKS